MKVINNERAAIVLSVVTQRASVTRGEKEYNIAAGVQRLEIRPGESDLNVTDEFAKELVKNKSIMAYVEEGTLRFPEIKEFEKVHKTREKAIAERIRRITKAPQEEAPVDAGADAKKIKSLESKVDSLTKLVKELSGSKPAASAKSETKEK